MWGRLKTLVLAAVVGAAALVPLFGDTRSTPVTHPLWARLLLRALELREAVRSSGQASQVFAVLSWRDSLSLPADRYRTADGVSLANEAGQRLVVASGVPGEVTYTLAVAQPGDYQLRARLSGPAGPPASVEIAALEAGTTRETFALPPARSLGWVFGGSLHLDPGAYSVQFLLPPGCSLARIEIAPPCLNAIEPQGGWTATGVTTAGDLAVTVLKALDAEHALAPAALPLELSGAQFEVEAPVQPAGRGERTALIAGTKGLRAVVMLDAPQAGLYSLSSFGTPGAGQRWLIDGCRKAVVCAGLAAGWRPILSQRLAAGRHLLALTLAPGASVERLLLERKKHAPEDYLAALERLGFDPGPPGPITHEKAIAAARFVRDTRHSRIVSLCGDQITVEEPPTAMVARAPQRPAEQAESPAVSPVVEPAEPVEPPVGPPLLPPQPPASPTQHGGT